MPDSPKNNPANTANASEQPPVGYRNPPRHTRFQKGQPFNRKRRPKREETYAELFRKELNKRIWVQENGKRIRITKRRAWMKRVANGTVKRERNSVKTFLKIERPGEPRNDSGLNFYIIGGG